MKNKSFDEIVELIKVDMSQLFSSYSFEFVNKFSIEQITTIMKNYLEEFVSIHAISSFKIAFKRKTKNFQTSPITIEVFESINSKPTKFTISCNPQTLQNTNYVEQPLVLAGVVK